MTFGRELVGLGAFLEVVMWRFDPRSFYVSSLRVKLILACQEVLKMSWALNEPKMGCFLLLKHYLKDAPQVEINS